MTIRQSVLDYLSRAINNPGSVTRQDLLQLQKDARETYDDSFYALFAPAAPLRWEVKTVLLSASQSVRIPFPMPFKSEIIALRPALVILNAQTGGAGVVVPTVDDIDVAVDLDGNRFFTNAAGKNYAAEASADGNFVTLGSLGGSIGNTSAPSLWRMTPDGASSTLGFNFRWKQPINVYKDTQICVTIYAKKAPV